MDTLPADSADRLHALQQLDIMDSAMEPAYEALVRLAATICRTPVAQINFVDHERQWTKATVGLPGGNTAREVAFCSRTVLAEEPLIVEDARRDPRFCNNPLVTGAPHVRFYAGQPLRSSGQLVGALCVVDHRPRRLSGPRLAALEALSIQAGVLLALRLRTKELEREVAERRRAERDAQSARARAEAANQAKSDFLSRMSHELRTPLNSIIGFARALQRGDGRGRGGEETGRFLERIEANGHHLLRVIEDILDLGNAERGQLRTEIVSVDLGALIGDTVGELQGRIVGDALAVRLTADVPEGLRPLSTDPRRLKQMLINLVGNALKFTARGQVIVRVAAEEGRATRIHVEDTGIGIPPDRQQAVFEAFEQATRDIASTYGGTGLGLAISRAIATALGYRLTLRSAEGVGSTFTIELV